MSVQKIINIVLGKKTGNGRKQAMSNFIAIDNNKLKRFVDACTTLRQIQHDENEYDTDTLLNEYRDAIVATMCGFDLINDDKHGWDAANSNGEYLEVKAVSSYCHSIKATFNDTTDEKCDRFAAPNNYLALAVWSDIITIDHITYGETCIFAEYLREKVHAAIRRGNLVRPRTQSISEGWLLQNGFKQYHIDERDTMALVRIDI